MAAEAGLHDIPTGLIDPDPAQARKHFDPAKLAALADSIAVNGLAVPILVRPSGGQRYTIVHGERRWRAVRSLGRPTIRVEVRDATPEEATWLSLVENVQRADLTPIEEAEAYRSILEGGMTQAALGGRLGKSQGYIAQKLRLLALPDPVAFYLARGAISEGHVRQLLRLRGILTAELAGDFSHWRKDEASLAGLFSEPCYTFALFLCIRPEDRPPWHPFKVIEEPERPASRLISEASARFVEYVKGLDYAPPRWAVSAFWWASLVVDLALPVAGLQKGITCWEERFLSAILFTRGVAVVDGSLDPAAQDAERERQRWGYQSDLRHAGASGWIEGEIPEAVVTRAYEMAATLGSVAGPSSHPPCHVT
jgi:ParB/RepB/Spo0J family partition protein